MYASKKKWVILEVRVQSETDICTKVTSDYVYIYVGKRGKISSTGKVMRMRNVFCCYI